jgi:hypothetical protein
VQTLNPREEWSIEKTIAQACLLADSFGVEVEFTYDEIPMVVPPRADDTALLAKYRALKQVARYDF